MSNCPYCGKLTDMQLDSCVHCGGFLKKQGQQPAGRNKSSQTCPQCGALVREGDIICVACGTNLLTGQKIADEQKQVAPERNLMPWILGGLAAVLLLIVIVLVVMILTRDPVAQAAAMRENRQYTEAMNVLTNYIETHGDNGRAHMELGRVLWQMQDYRRAGAAFAEAARYDEDPRDARLFAVLSYGRSGIEGDQAKQIDLLDRMVTANPNDQEALSLLALARAAEQDAQAAVSDFAGLQSQGVGGSSIERAAGMAQALSGNINEAAITLQQALNLDPGNGDTQAALGVVHAASGDIEAAQEELNAAIVAGTSASDEVLVQLGILAAAEGNFREGDSLLTEAINNGVHADAARYYQGVCRAQIRMQQDALSTFESLASKPGPYSLKAAVAGARIHLAQGNYDQASRTLEGSGGRQGGESDAAYLTTRGQILAALGEQEAALEALRNAIQVSDGNYAPAHLEIGLIYVERENFAEGIRQLESYLSQVDENDRDSGVQEIQTLVEQLRGALSEGSDPADAVEGAV